jgi:lipoprotein-releasing system permease protein
MKRMPYELFLALRYLRSRRKRKLARATSIAAILGITLGVAALIIAFALSNGFRDEMRKKILQGTSHISIIPREFSQQLSEQTIDSLQLTKIDGVTDITRTTYDGALVQGPNHSAYAVIRGVEKDHQTIPESWIQAGFSAPILDHPGDGVPSGVVGNELAARIGVGVGDTIQVIPANRFSSSSAEAIRKIRIAGIFRSGLFEYDSTWIYVSLDTANALSDNNHSGSVVSVQVKDVDNVGQTAELIRKQVGNTFTVIDWQQANQPLFSALALERRMGLFIIGLIIAIASLNITSMLILVVVERRRDIAILTALGARRNGVMLLFVIEGAIVGLIGAIAGLVLGYAACVFGNYYKIVSLPSDVYSISNVPLNVHLSEAVLAAFVALALSVLATIYPARVASQTRPIEVLRDSV